MANGPDITAFFPACVAVPEGLPNLQRWNGLREGRRQDETFRSRRLTGRAG